MTNAEAQARWRAKRNAELAELRRLVGAAASGKTSPARGQPVAPEVGQLRAELAKAQKRIADLEARPPTSSVNPDAESARLLEQNKALEIEHRQLQARIAELEAEAERLKRTGAAKSAPSGKLVMDEAVYKLIQKFLHPDLTTDPTEKQRRHEALTAFHGLPIAKVTMDERKAAEKEARRWAAETEEKRKQGEAIYRKRRAAGLKAQETRRRNAEAKAREAGQKPAGQPH